MMMRTTYSNLMFKPLVRFLPLLLLASCQINPQASSPDVKYSQKSSGAVKLQVPPDLTDVTRGEQFVLPGDSGGSLARNTLLPQFESVRFQRDETQGWLVSAVSPEELWPRLQAFLRSEGFDVSRTQPLNGLIETQWRKINADAGTLKNLINTSTEATQRVAFRLERTDKNGTRIFARAQVAEDKSSFDESDLWTKSSSSPERSGQLLQRLLVFLGIDEQRAKGILDVAKASSLTKPVALQTTTAGSTLLLHYGYKPSISALVYAASKLGMQLQSEDASSGVLKLIDKENIAGMGATTGIVVQLNPLHISSVVVSVADEQGKRLEASVEKKLLLALQDQLT